MHQIQQKFPDAPVLIVAPTGNDARNAASVLDKARISARICDNIRELCARANDHTGALLIGEEIFDQTSLQCLFDFLARQAPWSDMPLILLTSPGDLKPRTNRIVTFLGDRANITVLEKPVRAMSLISLIQASLRSRGRQFEVRDLLKNYAQAMEDEKRATAKFRALFEQASVFAGIMTLNGRLVETNRRSLETCGYTSEEVLGKPFWECGWWRGSKEAQHKLEQGTVKAAQGETFTDVLSYLWADGSEHVMQFGLYPIRDDSGQVIFLHPTGNDITETQHALARTEFLGQLSQKLSTESDPLRINRMATCEIGQFLGADRCYFLRQIAGGNAIKVLPDWRRNREASIEGAYDRHSLGSTDWWRQVQQGPVAIADVRTHRWTREFLTAYEGTNTRAYTMVPFLHEGRWVACLCVSAEGPREWTPAEINLLENALARVWPLIERAQAEASLREAHSLLADKASHLEALVQQRTIKLQEMIGDLEAFSYSIAHDMRAPLRSLQSFSEILLTEHSARLDGEGQFLLQRIAAAAARMDKLIRDVLNYSRIMRSEFPLETVDVGKLLRDILDTYPAFAAEKADIVIEGSFPPVRGNEAMLTQVFSNLLGNGIKFVPPGQKPQLKLWAKTNGTQVRMFVQDQGIGIPPDQHEKIFGIFQQASKDFEGTGIGLAIAKKAVERIGGAIGVWSDPGKGSTFWIDAELAGQPQMI